MLSAKNEKRQIGFFESIYKVVLFLTIIYFIEFPIWHNEVINQMVWISTALLLAFACIYYLSKYKLNLFYWVVFFCIILVVLMGFTDVEQANFSDRLVYAGLYLIFLLSIVVCAQIQISKKLYDLVFIVAIVLSLLFVVYSFTPIAYIHFYKGQCITREFLCFGFDNPNKIGGILLLIFGVLFVNLPQRKYKIPIILLMGYLTVFIFRTESRTSFFSIIFLWFVLLFYRWKRIPRWIVWACFLFPILFLFAYLGLHNLGMQDFELLNDKTFFSGRQEVYMSYLVQIDTITEFFIGDFSASGFQNAHNAPLSIFTSSGLIGLIGYSIIYLSCLFKMSYENKGNIFAVFVILACFIHSSAEANISTGFPGIVLMSMLFLLANYKPVREEKEMLDRDSMQKIGMGSPHSRRAW